VWYQIKALHLYDCQRANKSTSAWGLEARVPFLDREFMDVAMSIDPAEKMIRKDQGRIEKWVLRKAFDDEENPYLPKVTLKTSPICRRSLNLTIHTLACFFLLKAFFLSTLNWCSCSQHILYRQKEQFSDGVGYSWIDGLKAHAESNVLTHPLLLSSLLPVPSAT
jgi:asparagine synthase (glutamine-hydrolysing)